MRWDAASRYRLLLKINNAIVRETSRTTLFNALGREISRIFPYDRFSINLYMPETETLSYFATADGVRTEEIEAQERPLEHGAIANAVIRSRKPLIIPDLRTHTYWASVRSMIKAGLKATMAYPLIVRDQIIGTMHLSFRNIPEHFEELVDFLSELADQVAIAVDNMMAYTRLKVVNENLQRQNEFLMAEAEGMLSANNFFFASTEMRYIMRQAKAIADSDAPVLITGETGTGKDQVARFIHSNSSRRNALFVKVNCPALTPTLFESELFGHSKGAFTGADRQRIGRFEMADGGTIFLDEIGELPLPLQAKLLHVLQDQVFERVGETRPISVNFRIIAATNRDLDQTIKEGLFRSDLYYRLNTITLHLPPLRQRIEDIPLLVNRLSEEQAILTHRPAPLFTASSIEEMQRYKWPGNVRELKNLIKRLFILRPGSLITDLDIRNILRSVTTEDSMAVMSLADAERSHLEKVLAITKGRLSGAGGAAHLLGIPRTTLQYRLKKHGIDPKTFAK